MKLEKISNREKYLLKIAKEIAFEDSTVEIALKAMKTTYEHYSKEAEIKSLIKLNRYMLKAINEAIRINQKIQHETSSC